MVRLNHMAIVIAIILLSAFFFLGDGTPRIRDLDNPDPDKYDY